MLPDQVSNPGPLTYESGALPIALRGPANCGGKTDGRTDGRKTGRLYRTLLKQVQQKGGMTED